MPQRTPWLARVLIACLLLLPPLAARAVSPATIGPQANCDYSSALAGTIQAALNAGYVEIRLVGGTTFRNNLVVAGDADIRILGGYADCTAAANGQLPSNPVPSRIEPNNVMAATIAVISSPSRLRNLVFSDLDLRAPAGALATGPGLMALGFLDLTLERSRISGFRYDGQGGGMRISDARVSLRSSEISDNHALSGGGLYCMGGQVRLDPASRLLLNQAIGFAETEGHGGGAELENCDFDSHGRVLPSTLGGTSGIIANRARHDGGGIHATDSRVRILGGPFCGGALPDVCLPRLAIVGANQAGGHGGAFALQHAQLELDFSQVSANTGVLKGGAIHAAAESEVRFGGLAGLHPGYDRSHCHEGRYCEVLSDNRLSFDGIVTGNGGGVSLEDSTLAASELLTTGNSAAVGNAIHATSAASVLLDTVLMHQPDASVGTLGAHALHLVDAFATVRDSTLVNHAAMNSLVRAEGVSMVDIQQSVIADFGTNQAVSLAATATLSGACNAHRGSLPANAGAVFALAVTAADFAVADGVSPDSNGALVDACAGAHLPPGSRDILGRPRPAAQTPASAATPMDIGAIELPGDTVFADQFE
jgi:hypothetical protein